MSLRRIALRYMTRFRCIGQECEDSCCHGWKVTVDQGHYARLKRAEGASAQRERFPQVVKLVPPRERDKAHFAIIEMAEDGACPFLDGDRLCSIQRRHGESLLPDTCSLYPRHANRVGERLELTGALSCPEVTRQALLGEDATDLIEAPEALFGRGVAHHDLSTDGLAGFARHLDEIRGTMYEIVSRRDAPLAHRLYLTALLADRTELLFQRQPFDQQALEEAIDQIARPAVLASLQETLGQAQPSLARGIEVVLGLLSTRMDTAVRRAFSDVVNEVLKSYGTAVGASVIAGSGARDDLDIELGTLAAAYARRLATVSAAFDEIIERCCYNYCRHFWISEWYVLSGSLRVHATRLLAQVALQRFLLLSHPDALMAAASGDGAAFERLAVRVFYSFARGTGHNPAFAALCRERLAAQIPDLSAALCLLAV